MEQGRRSLIAAIPPKENVWSIALEYFRIFHYGLPATSQFMTYSTMEPCAQLDFVQNSMAPDVVFNGERGPEAVIKSWGCLSHWFKDISVDLDRLTKGPAGSVIASTVTTVTITEQTLRQVFPRLWMLDGRGGCLVSTLVNKLRGQRLVMRGSTHFEWDGGYGRVICVRTMADMLTPLLELLGNVEDVARVFNEALITPEFQLRSIE
ncbi:hypothetical protein PHMEG_00029713 [Phytophthora megakarya]|uniref:Bzip transcription factor n=1 Tax=Phytophthora megakarya TaxID=4795 RepID=A0A225V1Z0_9STRA|nr:hypothetical protein PHMEG_00029713 [Phytophthora megakarya]